MVPDGIKVENSLQDGIFIYPFPFNDQLKLEYAGISADAPAKVMLINLNGVTIDVSSRIVDQRDGLFLLYLQQLILNNGIYMLKLETAGEKPVFKRVLRKE